MEEPIDLAGCLIDHPAASYPMRVSGHFMGGAGIVDDDMVVVSRAVESRPGDIVAALVHGDRTMKRLRLSGDRLWLVSSGNSPHNDCRLSGSSPPPSEQGVT